MKLIALCLRFVSSNLVARTSWLTRQDWMGLHCIAKQVMGDYIQTHDFEINGNLLTSWQQLVHLGGCHQRNIKYYYIYGLLPGFPQASLHLYCTHTVNCGGLVVLFLPVFCYLQYETVGKGPARG